MKKKILYTSNGGGQMIVWPPDFPVWGGAMAPWPPPWVRHWSETIEDPKLYKYCESGWHEPALDGP